MRVEKYLKISRRNERDGQLREGAGWDNVNMRLPSGGRFRSQAEIIYLPSSQLNFAFSHLFIPVTDPQILLAVEIFFGILL